METVPPLHNEYRRNLFEAVQNARSVDGILLDTRTIEIPHEVQYGLTVREIRIKPAEDVSATLCVVEKHTPRDVAYDIRSYILFDDPHRPLRYCEALIPRSEESLRAEIKLDEATAAWYRSLQKAHEGGVLDLTAELERLKDILTQKQIIYREIQELQAQLDTAETAEEDAELTGLLEQKYREAEQVDTAVKGPDVDFKKDIYLAEDYMIRYEDFQRNVDASNRLRELAANEAREVELYHQRLLESGEGFDLTPKEAWGLITILDKCVEY